MGDSTAAGPAGDSILASPFARRLLLLFVVSAFAPALLLGVLATRYVEHRLEDTYERHAQHLVKAVGLTLFDWLLRRDAEIEAVMASLQAGQTDPSRLPLGNRFLVRALGEVAGLTPEQVAALRKGRSVFEQVRTRAGTFYEFSRLLALPTHEWLVTNRVRDLPSAHNVLPSDIDYCYIDADGVPIRCSATPPSTLAAGLRAHGGAGYHSFHVVDGPRTQFVRTWQIFLGAEFGLADWKIVIWHDEDDLLLADTPYGEMLGPVILVGCLTAVLFATVAIRRHLQPFRTLTDAARRIGPDNLDVTVHLRTGDELERLGGAFNDMAQRLKRNFELQSALAAIDRDALSASDPASTVTALLSGLGRLLHTDWACVWFHDERSGQLLMMVQDAPGTEPRLARVDSSVAATCSALLGAEGWLEVPVELQAARTATGRVVELVFAVPLPPGERAAAAVWVAPQGGGLGAEEEHTLRELSARLAVALVNFAAREDLFREAHFDTLTGLPNRRLFLDMLDAALGRAPREGHAVGLLFVDLDDFKYVNDSLGHATGDRLLQAVAARLRQTIGELARVARLGGDEFVIILPTLPGDEAVAVTHIERLAEKVLAELRLPINFDGVELLPRASIGAAIHPRDGANADELLRAADAAMYATKDDSRGSFKFFSPNLNAKATRLVALQAELVRAVERDEFILHYQPQISVTDGSVVGCEALLRWQHPTRGLLGPGEFLAEAEASGLIGEIGSNTLRRAARQLAAWHELGLTELAMSVNVSARQFDDPHLINMVANIVDDIGIPASQLELEITESVACRRLDHTVRIMSELAAIGVRLAIDDFGTGHSSLSYLQRMPLHTLKVDRSFVIEIGVSRRGESIVDAIVALGKCLSLDIVAEGVETAEQQAYLAARGCDLIQGWLYRPALAPMKFVEYVMERRAIARVAGGQRRAPRVAPAIA